jgi:NADPH-dependent curcumin reductase CurA
MQNQQIVLSGRPNGMVKANDMALHSAPAPELHEGQLLVKNHFLSVDPAIRYWLNAGMTYIRGVDIGEPVRCFAAGEVVASRADGFFVGQWVTGLFGAQEYAISDGSGVVRCDPADGSLSLHLGVLGMPGMTAYFGLLDKGQPQAGEVVFVSGAAGVVGTTVGQIARLKGCRVIGSAGSDEKCRYLVEAGFDAAFNYKTEGTDAALKRLAPGGVHIYFDNVGGDTLDAALLNLARGARVVICGALSQYNESAYAGPKNYMKILTARGILTGLIVFDYALQWPTAVRELAGWLREGKVSTREVIEPGLKHFPDALVRLYQGGAFGKLLVAV